MIDPVTIGAAFAGAKAAVAGIKEVIKLGKDVGEITNGLVTYLEHKTVIEKAEIVKGRESRENKYKKTQAELTLEAMDIVMKRKRLEKEEYELYQLLVWSGNSDIWHDMVKIRDEMRRKMEIDEANEIQEKMLEEKKKSERQALIGDICLVVGSVSILVLLLYAIVQLGISEGLWLAHSRR